MLKKGKQPNKICTPGKKGKHKCCYCPNEYKSSSGLWYHKRACHPGQCKKKKNYQRAEWRNQIRERIKSFDEEEDRVLTDYELWGLDGDYSNYSYPILNEPGMLEDVVTLKHNDPRYGSQLLYDLSEDNFEDLEKYLGKQRGRPPGSKNRIKLQPAEPQRAEPYGPEERKKAIKRWKSKRTKRNWLKKLPFFKRRRDVAKSRRRVKGRFVNELKVGGKKKRRKTRRRKKRRKRNYKKRTLKN